jgi:diguanylate cyclase (GGDEF)-like protein/PAS domain S-box-containing protein
MDEIDLNQFIEKHHKSLLMVLDLIPIPAFIKDTKGNYLSCNTSFENATGFTRQQIQERSATDLWGELQAEIFLAKDQELFDNPGLQIYDTKITNTEGVEYFLQFHKTTFTNSKNDVSGLLGVIFDLTKIKQLEQSLLKLSQIDELTQILNRRAGLDQMEKVLKDSTRKNKVFSIALIDIDHFKKLNDTYGHSIGDLVLTTIAEDLVTLSRETDIFFRYGGDEFVICMPETSLGKTKGITERLLAKIDAKNILTPKGDSLDVTLSIGLAEFPKHGINLEQLIEASDKAMYIAKKSGRNCIREA